MLVVYGEEDLIMLPRYNETAAGRIAGARSVRIAGCRHLAFIERRMPSTPDRALPGRRGLQPGLRARGNPRPRAERAAQTHTDAVRGRRVDQPMVTRMIAAVAAIIPEIWDLLHRSERISRASSTVTAG